MKRVSLILPWMILLATSLAMAADRSMNRTSDWPTRLGDQNRSGSSEEKLPDELKPAWIWQSRHAPSPALTRPRGSAKRGGLGEPLVQTSTSDNAFQVVVAGGKLYFGSSVEESVTCLNAADGKRLWTFYSEGAIRFAPLCHEGKVYFGSDDGYVYCVDGDRGELVWKFQAAIGRRRIIANGRISSQWPVRTGLAMRDNVVYAACGVFPSEDRGVMVYALSAAAGKPVWKQRFLNHAAGHLLAREESLLIPTGRSSPRAMKRSNGSGQPPVLGGREREGGGSPCLVSGMLIYGPNENGFLKVHPTPDGPERTTGLQGWRMVADAERIFVLRNDGIHALEKAAFTKALVASCKAFGSKEEAKERALEWQRRGIRQVHLKRHQQGRDEPLLMEDIKACTVWKAANEAGLVSMIRAGDVIVTGGKGLVQTHNAKDGTRLWSSKVDGTVWDLAVADETLFASTDTGAVYCFRKDGAGTIVKPQQPPRIPFADNEQRAYRVYAERVLAQADTRKGYCAIVGICDGRLAYEIATQSELFVLGIEPDAERVTRARKNLDAGGLYGKRVSVHQASADRLPYLSYFANVILSETAFESGKLPFAADAVFPMLQPCGGLMVIAGGMDKQTLQQWGQSLSGWTVQDEGGLSTGSVVRGKLAGSGEWTHMFADPANTLCSRDKFVAGTQYDIQWIGSPGSERQYGWHAMSMTDLYKDGRLYLTRSDHVMALDAYNGTMLWGLDVPGSLRLGVGHESGQACVDSDYLYVAATNDCWLIDAVTGNKARAYVVPDGKSDWGYVAIVGDLLVGSSQSPTATYNIQNPWGSYGYGREPRSRVRTAWGVMHNTQVISTDLFALGKNDGAKRWQYKTGSHILNSSVASDGRAIFFVESRNPALPGALEGIVFLNEFFEKDAFLVALDLKTGVKQWDKPFASKGEEVFYLSCTEGALLSVTSANTPFEGPEREKEKNYYQLRLFDARDGSERWSTSVVGGKEGYKHGVNIQPAVIMGGKAYLSMRTGGRLFTFDLATGKCTETPQFRGSKGCGVMTGSGTSLFFRNMGSQAYDTLSGQTFWTSSVSRPSCWLNDIPAGGLVLMPEATTGCDCAFAMQVSIVLAPSAKPRTVDNRRQDQGFEK